MANSVENTQKKSLQRTAKIPKIMGVANKKTLLQCHAPMCILRCCILRRCRFFRYNLRVCLQLSWIFWNSFHIAQVFVCLHFVNRSECYVRPNLYILWWSKVIYLWVLTTFWVRLDRWYKSVRRPWTTFAKNNFSLFEFKSIKSFQKKCTWWNKSQRC